MRFFSPTTHASIVLTAALFAGATGFAPAAKAQASFEIFPAEPVLLPFVVDSNSPTFWRDGSLYLFSSAGSPMINTLDEQFQHLGAGPVVLDHERHLPMWIESVWQDRYGTLYGWYHHERIGVCPNSTLTTPEIGAVVSYNGGRSFTDLGIVLSSGEITNCFAQNGYFANGHGDFSVIADREEQYFYFLFGAYGGDVSNQGIAIARMPFAHMRSPVGAVWKYHQGAWSQPGIGGKVTPVFPASVSWSEENTDSFWGPSIHWNTYLQRFVVLMNRSCCRANWPQEGIYITTNANLADPAGWTEPEKIITHDDWYPFVIGLGPGETSSEAGQRVRLFTRNFSEWELVFHLDEEPEESIRPHMKKRRPKAPYRRRWSIPPSQPALPRGRPDNNPGSAAGTVVP